MSSESNNIIDIDGSLRILGTAHVSSESVHLVRSQIEEWGQTWLQLSCAHREWTH